MSGENVSFFPGNSKIDNSCIHAYTVSMEKMQILFPEPQLARLRRIAGMQDRPVSELVRSAVDFWLSRYGGVEGTSVAEGPPAYGCGQVLTESSSLRDKAYEGRNGL